MKLSWFKSFNDAAHIWKFISLVMKFSFDAAFEAQWFRNWKASNFRTDIKI